MPARRTVLALTVLALAVRVATLDVQSFWSDEAATVGVLRHSFGGMLHAVWDGESTPPLFYVVTWLWSKLAGTGEVALRLPSAVFGAAAVPVVAALAARLASGWTPAAGADGSRTARPAAGAGTDATRTAQRAAVAGAALTALGPLTVWYGQEARAYALLMLLAAGSTLALLRALEAPSRGRLAAWAALAVAAFWTHHFALFVVVGQGLWLLWRLRARAVPAVAVTAAGAVALAPILLHQRDAGRATFIADVPFATRLAQVPKQVLVGYDGPAETPLLVLGVLAVLVALAGLAVLLRPSPRVASAPPVAVVLTITAGGLALPILAAAGGQDFLLTRNLLGLLPLVLALLAAGAAALPGRAALAGAGAALALTGIGAACAVAVDVDEAYQRDDFRAAVTAVEDGPARARLVVTDAAGRIPASLYLGHGTAVVVPGQPQTVTEIDVVRVAGNVPGRRRSTPVLPAVAPPAGFALVADRRGTTWAARRYVAPTPTPVDPAAVAGLNAGRAPIVLFRPR